MSFLAVGERGRGIVSLERLPRRDPSMHDLVAAFCGVGQTGCRDQNLPVLMLRLRDGFAQVINRILQRHEAWEKAGARELGTSAERRRNPAVPFPPRRHIPKDGSSCSPLLGPFLLDQRNAAV